MIIIKYGGSIINPDGFYDQGAIDKLVSIIKEYDSKSFCFVIGGGRICRLIQDASKPFLERALPSDQLDFAVDEIGIAVTKINARFILNKLLSVFGSEVVFPDLLINPHVRPSFSSQRVFLATGARPGSSTDFDMMVLARTLNADKIIKISDFPFVLDVPALSFDKNKINNYKPLPRLSWDKMISLVGEEWVAGGNYPLDPKAAVLGKELALPLLIGRYSELDKMISGSDFEGSVVS